MNKILLVHITQSYGGLEKRFYSYGKYLLSSADNNYTVIFSRALLSIQNEEIPCGEGNRLIKYGFPWKKKNKMTRYLDYLFLFSILISLYLFKSYDAVHFTTTTIVLRYFVRAKKKVYSVVTSEKKGLERNISSKEFERMMNARYLIDCLDRNIKEAVVTKFPDKAHNVFCAPCSFIDYQDTNTGVTTKKKQICFAGRLEGFKGADLLVKAIPAIIEQTGYHIVILGHGSYESSMKEVVSSHRLHDRVKILYTKDPKSFLRESRIFLSLQRDENYPSQSLIEAMACKNAVVATHVGLTADIVQSNFGILIDYDSKALVEALVKLTSQEDNLDDMGEKARAFAITNHNIERFNQYLLGIYG